MSTNFPGLKIDQYLVLMVTERESVGVTSQVLVCKCSRFWPTPKHNLQIAYLLNVLYRNCPDC